jgi:hypothetical protein
VPDPIDHDGRRYETYLRGPVGSDTFCFSTVEETRAGLHHRGLLRVHIEPADAGESDFGIVGNSSFKAEIADEGTEDWFLTWEDGSFILWENLEQIVVEY